MLRMIRWVCDLLRDLHSSLFGAATMEEALCEARRLRSLGNYRESSDSSVTMWELMAALLIMETGSLECAIKEYYRIRVPSDLDLVLEAFERWTAEQGQK